MCVWDQQSLEHGRTISNLQLQNRCPASSDIVVRQFYIPQLLTRVSISRIFSWISLPCFSRSGKTVHSKRSRVIE